MRVLLFFAVVLLSLAAVAEATNLEERSEWSFFKLQKRLHSLVTTKYHHNTERLKHTGNGVEGKVKIVGRHVSSFCLTAHKAGKMSFSGTSDQPVEVFYGTQKGLNHFLANKEEAEDSHEAHEAETKEWGFSRDIKEGDNRCVWVAHSGRFFAADVTYKLRGPEGPAKLEPDTVEAGTTSA